MRLCRFDDNRVGLVFGDEVADVTHVVSERLHAKWPFPRKDVLIERLPELRAEMEKAAATAPRRSIAEVGFLSPVANPGKIIGAPANYLAHNAEAERDKEINLGRRVAPISEMGLFLKATSSLVGFGEKIVVDRADRRTDHEIELGVIIGKGGRRISIDNALSHVAGYAIALDMTIRGMEERSLRKSLDSFSVLGPWMVTADEFGDPHDRLLELHVNGEPRQKASTSGLIYDVPKLIEYASEHYTLEPGDIIMTGTPEGVGPVSPGDKLKCSVDGVGSATIMVE